MHKIRMERQKFYESKKNELNDIIKELKTGFDVMSTTNTNSRKHYTPKFKSMVEITSKNEKVTECPGCIESDYNIERVAELEDEILDLKEEIFNLRDKTKNISKKVPVTVKTCELSDIKGISSKINRCIRDTIDIKEKSNIINVKASELIVSYNLKLNDMENIISELLDENNKKKNEIEDLKVFALEVEKCKERIQQQKEIEKILKDEILDLKGSIRVYCRIKPNNQDTKPSRIRLDEESMNIDDYSNKIHNFKFDRIFGPQSDQNDLFKEILPLIHNGMNGYNICIFAYGQTGSGKTHTMEGPESNRGIIYRSINEIFATRDNLESKGWICDIYIKVIEIYNENINDLLSDNNKKIEVKFGENNQMILSNCEEFKVNKKEEIDIYLNRASMNRSVGATMANERSSRSHSVFILTVKMKNEVLKEFKESTFNFIDLAGSERLNHSKAEGERLKETQNINKSLSALGNVVMALVKGDQHIPFRDSKLTYLLKNYLTGNSKVLMFVNIAPEISNFNESLCSLRFAYKVSECKLGTAGRNFYKEI